MCWSNVLVKCNVKIYYSFVPILVFLASTPFQPYSTLVPFHLSDGPPSLLVMSRPSSGVEFSSSPLNETTAPLLTSLQSEHCLCFDLQQRFCLRNVLLGRGSWTQVCLLKSSAVFNHLATIGQSCSSEFHIRAAQIKGHLQKWVGRVDIC